MEEAFEALPSAPAAATQSAPAPAPAKHARLDGSGPAAGAEEAEAGGGCAGEVDAVLDPQRGDCMVFVSRRPASPTMRPATAVPADGTCV